MIQVKNKSERLRRNLFMSTICILNQCIGIVRNRKGLPDPQYVKRIAVLQMTGIGDLLLVTPALTALSNIYPNAKIDIITYNRQNASFLLRLPYIGKCILFPLFDLELKSVLKPSFWRLIMKPVKEIRNGCYDIYISFHHPWLPQWYLLELLLAAFSGARLKVGINPDNRKGTGFFDLCLSEAELGDRHYSFFFLDLVHLLGDFDDDGKTFFPLLETEREAAKEYINLRMPNMRGIVCFHVGASSDNRRWPADYYRELAERFISLGYGILLIGTEKERRLNNDITYRLSAGKCLNIAGKTSIFQMAAFIDSCDLFIGNDSGPLHIAVARKKPSIGILIEKMSRYHQYHSNEVTILFNRQSPHSEHWIADKVKKYDWNISINQVYKEAMKLLP